MKPDASDTELEAMVLPERVTPLPDSASTLVIPDESFTAPAKVADPVPVAPVRTSRSARQGRCPCRSGPAGAHCRNEHAHRALCTADRVALAKPATLAGRSAPSKAAGAPQPAPPGAVRPPAPTSARTQALAASPSNGATPGEPSAESQQPRLAKLLCGSPPDTEQSRRCLVKLQKVCDVPVQSPQYTECLMAIATVGAQSRVTPTAKR